MNSIPIGSLIRDTDHGDIGIVVGPLVSNPVFDVGQCSTQLVLWPSNHGEPYEMDLSAVEQGWVEVLNAV